MARLWFSRRTPEVAAAPVDAAPAPVRVVESLAAEAAYGFFDLEDELMLVADEDVTCDEEVPA